MYKEHFYRNVHMLMKLNPYYKIILPLYNLYTNIYILNTLQIYMIAFYEIKNGD